MNRIAKSDAFGIFFIDMTFLLAIVCELYTSKVMVLDSLKIHNWYILVFLFGIWSCSEKKSYKSAAPNKGVFVIKTGEKYQLYRNGAPFKVKGACGTSYLHELKNAGGNSFRTYDTDHLDSLFDLAEKFDLTVTVGLWLDRYYDFDYSDTVQTKRKLIEIESVVQKYMHKKNLLMWAIGNEIHPEDKPAIDVWKFVNRVSQMIHEKDSLHPTTTILAGYPRKHMTFITIYCTDLDLLCFNSFGGINELHDKMNNPFWGYNGPYMIGEYSTYGYWEPNIPKKCGILEEYSDSVKAQRLYDINTILEQDKNNYLGSFVFDWEYRFEYTPTWFSMFGKNGENTALIEKMNLIWKGTTPKNYVPKITEMSPINFDNSKPIPTNFEAKVNFEFNNEPTDTHTFEAEILTESLRKRDRFYREILPEKINTKITIKDNTITFIAPSLEGPFRLFFYIKDNHNNIARHNLPFYVEKN